MGGGLAAKASERVILPNVQIEGGIRIFTSLAFMNLRAPAMGPPGVSSAERCQRHISSDCSVSVHSVIGGQRFFRQRLGRRVARKARLSLM